MEFDINYTTVEESNMFLRALWTKLRNDGQMGWNFTPYKDAKNKIISLGFVSTNVLSGLYYVKIKYEIRGCIKKLIFEPQDSNGDVNRDYEMLITIVDAAKNYKKDISTVYLRMAYKTIGEGIDNYCGKNFRIINYDNEFSIIFAINGFDKKDVGSELAKINGKVIDFLSTQISHVIFQTDNVKALPEINDYNNFASENWVDTYPIINNRIKVMEKSVEAIDKIISQQHDDEFEKYIDACRLFHTATKYTSFIYDYDNYDFKQVEYGLSFEEVANMLYMSSFEVLASIMDSNDSRCESCNQNIFSIRQKVIKLIENYSEGYMDKGIIDDYYKKRSAYVHSGEFFSNRSYYGGVSNPQLSKSDIGVIMQLPYINLLMLRDVGGFIFRRFLIEYFKL
jgi:hypothetical protein